MVSLALVFSIYCPSDSVLSRVTPKKVGRLEDVTSCPFQENLFRSKIQTSSYRCPDQECIQIDIHVEFAFWRQTSPSLRARHNVRRKSNSDIVQVLPYLSQMALLKWKRGLNETFLRTIAPHIRSITCVGFLVLDKVLLSLFGIFAHINLDYNAFATYSS